MGESLCSHCSISVARILRRTGAGIVAIPDASVRSGHLVVVAASHAASFSDLSDADASALMTLVASSTRDAERASGAHYYVLRIGDHAPHLHFHLVPRAEGDEQLAPFVFGERGWASTVNS